MHPHDEANLSGSLSSREERLPKDVWIVGCLTIAWGFSRLVRGVGLLAGMGVRGPSLPAFSLFGAISIDSEVALGITYVVYASAFAVAGYALIKGRAYGWWMLALLVLNATGSSLRAVKASPSTLVLPVVGMFTYIWLALRAKPLRAFGNHFPSWMSRRMGYVDRRRDKVPLDAKVVSAFHLLVGFLFLLHGVGALTGILQDSKGPVSYRVLFGTLRVTSVFWVVTVDLIESALYVLTGSALIKRSRLGWWMCLLLVLNSIPINMIGLVTYGHRIFVVLLGVDAGVLAFLLARVRMYDPFRKRPKEQPQQLNSKC